MIHDRLPPEYKAAGQMQRAWDIPKIAACPDTGCACYSPKSQFYHPRACFKTHTLDDIQQVEYNIHIPLVEYIIY